MDTTSNCGYKSGDLPTCAPLAVPFVPFQTNAKPTYGANEALIRGTLFPGLDLPFKNIVNTRSFADTPMGELQALHFVCDELRLYLDTHSCDREAFEMLREVTALTKEAHNRYAEKYGPVSFDDAAMFNQYKWINDPWPWNYSRKEG